MPTEVLYKEAELMYKRAPGFKPLNGDLTHWTGIIKFNIKRKFSDCSIDIVLPADFPSSPPIVSTLTPIKHKIVNSDNKRFELKILKDWKPQMHIYDVVNVIKGEFAKSPPELHVSLKPISKPAVEDKNNIGDSSVTLIEEKIKSLESEINSLQADLAKKDEDVARLEAILAAHSLEVPSKKDIRTLVTPSSPEEKLNLDLEAEKIALEELIKKLEEKFESGDITAEDYSRIYKKYRRDLFIISKKISEIRK